MTDTVSKIKQKMTGSGLRLSYYHYHKFDKNLKIMSYVGTAHKQGYNAYEAIKNAISGNPDFIFE